MALAQNSISKSSILAAFLLSAETIVSLSYKLNGLLIFCEMNTVGNLFFLPTDHHDDYYLEANRIPSRPASSLKGSSDEHHQNRSESPRILDERLAMELRNRLFFIPKAQKAFDNPEKPSENENEIEGGVVSPISPRAAVTYAHRSHRLLRVFNEGGNLQENEHAIVEIRQCDNPSNRHNMKVIVIDAHHDFVILHSIIDCEIFDDYAFSSRPPRDFERFLGFDLSYKNHEGQQVTHRSGRICSVVADHRGRMLASASIDGGDSGGPCYAEDRSLIGIMVSSTTTDPLLGQEYDCDTIEKELRDASGSPADTWITPGHIIIEAFRYVLHHVLPE
ncbi:unnamed protein product [Caenorhabditis auriculariae]|uniref:Peptidase S1 domain-containing protein n=1 Tax=Caenorhabditis auriculariae TaxID=2777116 RepID=A0A8S1H456_9PELO|nr:unnamed protein product [Caenorhabditis auriculariae]